MQRRYGEEGNASLESCGVPKYSRYFNNIIHDEDEREEGKGWQSLGVLLVWENVGMVEDLP